MSSKDALLQRLSDDVFEMDDEDVVDACQEYIDGDYEALDGIMEGLVDGMGRAGKMYEEEEYFVSDILLCRCHVCRCGYVEAPFGTGPYGR